MKRGWVGLLVTALLGGCVAHEKNGDRAAAVGDWKSAYFAYRQALASDPDAQGLKDKYEQARAKALEDAERRGQTCARTADWECALAEADFALGVDDGNAQVASFRAQAATEVALLRLDRADALAGREQLESAIEVFHSGRALSQVPAVVARVEQVRAHLLAAGSARLDALSRSRDYGAALQLADLLVPLDGRAREWRASVERERDAFHRAEYERLTREGDAARHHGHWDEAAELYGAAVRLMSSGPAVPRAEHARKVAQAVRLEEGGDWSGAAAHYRAALQTGQDDGSAAEGLERVEVRPYRVALRSVLVAPVRTDGQAWAGATSALLYQAARMVTEAAEHGGHTRLVEMAAAGIPEENRPSLRVEVSLPDGTRLSTPARRGVFIPLDAEVVVGANALDPRSLSLRVVAEGAKGSESLGVVEVPLRKLTGQRGELRLRNGSVLALRLTSVSAEGRTPGAAVGMGPVTGPVTGAGPGTAGGTLPPAPGRSPGGEVIPASGLRPVPTVPAQQPAPGEQEGPSRPGRLRKQPRREVPERVEGT